MMFRKRQQDPSVFAAIDLGSNSFHMIVARLIEGELKIIDRLREPVRLASALDQEGAFTIEGMDNAIVCLKRFGQRLRDVHTESVRVVGTNALRIASNAEDLTRQAESAIGHPIEIISGMEEARLTYKGVAHGLADDGKQRLVVDIGGSSTELIIGKEYEPYLMRSFHIGCVSLSEKFFTSGAITKKAFNAAHLSAQMELEPELEFFKAITRDVAIGSSGTIRAIKTVVTAEGWANNAITLSALEKLVAVMIQAGDVKKLKLKELKADRALVLPGGVAALLAIFHELDIEEMRVSDSALREGLLYELVSRSKKGGAIFKNEDVRATSVERLAKRYHVDLAHTTRVADTAIYILERVAATWDLDDPFAAELLRWSAQLHVIGLNIAHNQYHKHSEYILENADLPGFSTFEQKLLAVMVRAHRKKLPLNIFKVLPESYGVDILHLTILLRIAVVLHRSRTETALPKFEVNAEKKVLRIVFPAQWLDAHPLTLADLEQEGAYLNSAGYKFEFC